MLVIVIILIILLLIATCYIFNLKKSIRKAANDINKIRGLDTNALITTTNGNLELRELLQEVNEMMLTFRKLEIDIEKKNNSLQKTIVNISHDLKTPLTSALGYVELLQKYELSGEEQHKYESIIIDKLKRLSQLIDDFFTFTKIISNEEKFELKLLDSRGDIYISINTGAEICFQFKNRLDEPIIVEQIFDEFYTSDISRTKQNTGLGLAIVKEFTEM